MEYLDAPEYLLDFLDRELERIHKKMESGNDYDYWKKQYDYISNWVFTHGRVLIHDPGDIKISPWNSN